MNKLLKHNIIFIQWIQEIFEIYSKYQVFVFSKSKLFFFLLNLNLYYFLMTITFIILFSLCTSYIYLPKHGCWIKMDLFIKFINCFMFVYRCPMLFPGYKIDVFNYWKKTYIFIFSYFTFFLYEKIILTEIWRKTE